MKRLSVRWKCAANGQEAVQKWQQGGFHLVLMDIQLPVMNGLDATKEIRRLERLNGIGVFPKTASGRSSAASANATSPPERDPETPAAPLKEEDTLQDLSLFKSPVIIVALTASSLQSDRHEALAAGCNDFLTKVCTFIRLNHFPFLVLIFYSPFDLNGWNRKSPNGAACRPSSTSKVGANGVVSSTIRSHHLCPTGLEVPCKSEPKLPLKGLPPQCLRLHPRRLAAPNRMAQTVISRHRLIRNKTILQAMPVQRCRILLPVHQPKQGQPMNRLTARRYDIFVSSLSFSLIFFSICFCPITLLKTLSLVIFPFLSFAAIDSKTMHIIEDSAR